MFGITTHPFHIIHFCPEHILYILPLGNDAECPCFQINIIGSKKHAAQAINDACLFPFFLCILFFPLLFFRDISSQDFYGNRLVMADKQDMVFFPCKIRFFHPVSTDNFFKIFYFICFFPQILQRKCLSKFFNIFFKYILFYCLLDIIIKPSFKQLAALTVFA